MKALIPAATTTPSLKPPLPKSDLEIQKRPTTMLGPPAHVQQQLNKFKERYQNSGSSKLD